MIDENFDLKPEMYNFNITIPVDPDTIQNIKVATFYDYQLREAFKEDMIVMAYADIYTPSGAGYVYIDGDLDLVQKEALPDTSYVRTAYNDTFFEFESSS